jgi:hypothetical protein
MKDYITYDGYDIIALYTENEYECQVSCDHTPACTAYTWRFDGECRLKYMVSYSVPAYNMSSGRVAVPYQNRAYIPLANSSFEGHDILYWNGTYESCAFVCDQMPFCNAYTLDLGKGANCWLKYALGGNGRSDTGFESYTSVFRPVREYKTVGVVDYPGNDIVEWNGPSYMCTAVCDQIAECVGFIVDTRKPKSCILKRKMESPRHDPYMSSTFLKT